jgi:hypothetical protein
MFKLKRARMVEHVNPTALLIKKILSQFLITFIGSKYFDEKAHFK